jgi:hypothetical protein
MLIHNLQKQGLIQPPKWLADNVAFLTVMGSVAYGVSSDSSDEDMYGFCLPPKDMTFPHLAGDIPGFGTQKQRFSVWQQHHIKTLDGKKEYDFSIYSIVQYFDLIMQCNPNMIDSLFVPERCIKHATEISRMVRDRRKMFLHKGAWHKFKGYAYSQLHKIEIKRQNSPEVVDLRSFCADHGIAPAKVFDVNAEVLTHSHSAIRDSMSQPERFELLRLCDAVTVAGPRFVNITKFGFDVKFAYHVVRLLDEVEQIMVEHDLDLQRNREQLKAIRRGEWTQGQIIDHFENKEKALEDVYLKSTLPTHPDEKAIKQLLIDCLEHHYGDISTAVARDNSVDALVRDIDSLLGRYR